MLKRYYSEHNELNENMIKINFMFLFTSFIYWFTPTTAARSFLQVSYVIGRGAGTWAIFHSFS